MMEMMEEGTPASTTVEATRCIITQHLDVPPFPLTLIHVITLDYTCLPHTATLTTSSLAHLSAHHDFLYCPAGLGVLPVPAGYSCPLSAIQAHYTQ